MAKNRYINTKFWDDSYIIELDPVEKLMFLYILTNPLTNICGIYEVPLKRIAFDTGIDKEMVKKILARFERDGKIKYINGWIAIKNWIKHQDGGEKVKSGIKTGLENAPEELYLWVNDRVSIPYTYPIDTLPIGLELSELNPNSNLKLKRECDHDSLSEPQPPESAPATQPPRAPSTPRVLLKPTQEEVFAYMDEYCLEKSKDDEVFHKLNRENESARFINHYSGNGWKIGGRAPMKDWKAAARNWVLNWYDRASGGRL